MSLLSILQGSIELKRVSANELAGPCPMCGGNDRFRVWPNRNRWWCRGCGKSGDDIQLLREWRGFSFREAAEAVGRVIEDYSGKIAGKKTIDTWEPKPTKIPVKTWQEKAGAFVSWASEQLLKNTSILQWLEQERGLTLETIKARRLGWNSSDLFRERESWGIEPKLNEKGNPSKLFISAGLVIPTFRGETLLRVRVRRSEPGDGQRYILVSGGSSDTMIFGEDKNTFVVVESELDAILLCQDAGDIAGIVALGSSSIRPDSYTSSILKNAKTVFVSLDSDDAGAKEAWTWWNKIFSKSKRWPVIEGKDPTEAKKNGLPLREWILAGLPEIPTQEPPQGTPGPFEGKISTVESETAPCPSYESNLNQKPEVLPIELKPSDGKIPPSDQSEYRTERAGIMEFDGGLSQDEAEARATHAYPCTCEGRRFWVSIHGLIVCDQCHPPADVKLVVRWIEQLERLSDGLNRSLHGIAPT